MAPDTTTTTEPEKNSPDWWRSVESACRERWADSKAFEAEPDDSRPKKFVTVAYPYPNSPQHIGHGRTYTLADVHARFWRLRGYNVLFPMGFHYTGTPILGMSRRVQDRDAELIGNLRDIYGVPERDIETFADPLAIARYFHNEIKMGMKEMGYSIDWRREFTTIDPAYSKFVEWQISTLRRLDLIIQGSHPVGWCPKDQNPVSQHDTLGDVEPAFTEYVMIKFAVGDYTVPVATLRPETIFGVTNLWVDPDTPYRKVAVSRDGDGAKAEKWIVSAECAYKLGFLGYDVRDEGEIAGSDLVGEMASEPVLMSQQQLRSSGPGRRIPVLPAKFVEPGTGTGIVMSVPAHAPYDWQALQDLRNGRDSDGSIQQGSSAAAASIMPISIIHTDGYGDVPAADAVSAIPDCGGQSDPRLEPATKELYSKEFYEGVMSRDGPTAQFGGMPVREAKDAVGAWLADSGCAETFLEIADAPVRCRCGSECVVKVLNDQWFLNYGNPKWKEAAHECLDGMDILPDEIRQEFAHVVDWLHERACARQHGLGTKLPWDDSWIVESLSDSVIYMAYYTISRFVNDGTVTPEQMTPEFFEYVMAGRGRNTGDAGGAGARFGADHDESLDAAVAKWRSESGIPDDALEAMRREFEYFYPVDYRHSGRDLVPNHLTFFVLNHVAIFSQKMWPRGIVVNGSVLMDGSKMSKSMGNIIPLRKAIREFGADPIRLAIIISAELLQDADFNMESVHGMRSKLEAMHAECARLGGRRGEGGENSTDSGDADAPHASSDSNGAAGSFPEDAWLLSRMRQITSSVSESMEKMRLREALHLILFETESMLQWHSRRATAKSRPESDTRGVLHDVMTARVTMLQPFAPHVTESMRGALGYSHEARAMDEWPARAGLGTADHAALQAESLLKSVLDDIASILKVTKMTPSRIILYVSGDGSPRRAIYRNVLQSVLGGESSMKQVMGGLMSGPCAAYAKKTPDYVQKAITDILSDPVTIREARLAASGPAGDNDGDGTNGDVTTSGTGSTAGQEPFSEFRFLAYELPGIASASFGAKVDVYLEDDPGIYDPKSKARHARPFKPAIFIE